MATKKEVEALIDRLADKTLSLGCHFVDDTGTRFVYDEVLPRGLIRTILGHPIYLHRVLAQFEQENPHSEGGSEWGWNWLQIIKLWRSCGIEKSLQQIVSESGWEEGYVRMEADDGLPVAQLQERLKSPEARALFKYLDTLFPNENKKHD